MDFPAEMDEYVDLFRRMQVPHYEDARQRYLDPRNLEKWTGVNEIYPYLGEVVREIAAGKLDSIEARKRGRVCLEFS